MSNSAFIKILQAIIIGIVISTIISMPKIVRWYQNYTHGKAFIIPDPLQDSSLSPQEKEIVVAFNTKIKQLNAQHFVVLKKLFDEFLADPKNAQAFQKANPALKGDIANYSINPEVYTPIKIEKKLT